MKATLSNDWDVLKVGSITLTTEKGVPITQIGFLSVNPELVNLRNYTKEMHQLAERLIDAINTKKG